MPAGSIHAKNAFSLKVRVSADLFHTEVQVVGGEVSPILDVEVEGYLLKPKWRREVLAVAAAHDIPIHRK